MRALALSIKFLTTCLLLLIVFAAHSQEVNTIALKGFVHDAIENKLNNKELAEKFFCTDILKRNDKYGEEARSYFEFALLNQRKYLRSERVNVDAVSFKKFSQLSEDEIPPKPFHMLHETSKVYAAVYQGKVLLFFLMNDSSIASTLLIGQGDEHYFLDFCH
jgi:hypothetical protein